MGLNSFYNSGSDVELLKSLEGSVVADQDELVKAMNKAGLVQKEVQVQGKNGTFTRKQWVKASESGKSESSEVSSGAKPSSSNSKKFDPFQVGGNNVTHYVDRKKFPPAGGVSSAYLAGKNIAEVLSGQSKEFVSKTAKAEAIRATKEAIRAHKKGLKDSNYRDALYTPEKEQKIIDAATELLSILENTPIRGESPKSKKPSLSDIQGYGYDSSTVTGDPTYLEIGKRGYFKIGKNKWQYNPSQGSALGGTYTDAQISDMVSKTSEEVKVMPSAKKNGNVTFKDYLDADKAGEADAGKTSRNDKKVVDAVKTQYIDNIYRKGKGVSDSQHESLCKKIAKQCGVSELDVWYEMTKQFTEFTDELDKKSQQSSSGKFKPSDFGFRAGGQETADLINDLDNSVGVKKISNGALGYGTATLENGESVKFESPDSGKPQLVWHGHIFSNVKDLTDYWSGVRKPQKSTTLGQKLSKEDAKKKTQSFTSSIGKTDAERNAFMNKVKAQGITWKEQNDNGTEVSVAINWMRCCMAMNKHFANGGTFDPDKK